MAPWHRSASDDATTARLAAITLADASRGRRMLCRAVGSASASARLAGLGAVGLGPEIVHLPLEHGRAASGLATAPLRQRLYREFESHSLRQDIAAARCPP